METYLNLSEVIIAVVLIIIVLLQVKGQGSGIFGSAQATFRTRRGVERTMFQFTIVLGVVFVLLSLTSVWLF